MAQLDRIPVSPSVEPTPNTLVQRDGLGGIKVSTIEGTLVANTYIHTQSSAAAQWIITHNLNKYPSVSIVDSANRKVLSDVTYTSLNVITLDFSAAFAGKAFLN